MSYAQVVNENLGSEANYRSVLSGVSFSHLTRRDATGPDHCPRDNPSIISAEISELGAALRWGFGVSDNAAIPRLTSAKQLAACEGTWTLPSEVETAEGGLAVNRLYPNVPNPFNPRTAIQYSLAQNGSVRIELFDIEGRLVRTLVDRAKETAGMHSVVWDGTNDQGRRVGSGIYWAQMRAGSFTSNRKLVVLK
jgi:hypothetical protein